MHDANCKTPEPGTLFVFVAVLLGLTRVSPLVAGPPAPKVLDGVRDCGDESL
jgi:hypothetical protein